MHGKAIGLDSDQDHETPEQQTSLYLQDAGAVSVTALPAAAYRLYLVRNANPQHFADGSDSGSGAHIRQLLVAQGIAVFITLTLHRD